jgi:hypothetical protein
MLGSSTEPTLNPVRREIQRKSEGCMMKASDVIAELTKLVAEHGDLETLYECKDGLLEITDLEVNDVEFLKPKGTPDEPTPVFVIS